MLVVLVLAWGSASSVRAEAPAGTMAPQSDALRAELKTYPHRIVFERFREGNWDLWIMDADGGNARNLTNTPGLDEMYPKASPDGSKLCFVVDAGKGKDRARSVHLMGIDGTGRTKVKHKSRWPCWGAKGKTIAYLEGPKKYTKHHNATGRLIYYDLATGTHTPHVNAKIARLLNPSWSPKGDWFVTTAAGGMGFGFAIIAFEAHGTDAALLLPSKKGAWQCRPDFAPDGEHIAYAKARGTGPDDKIFSIEVAEFDTSGPKPKLGARTEIVTAGWPTELYHADWSPEGKYIVYSKGPREMSKMKPQRPIIGILAPGWDICVARPDKPETWVALTTDGDSNKEPDWVFVEK